MKKDKNYMIMNKWTLLMTGENSGLVGEYKWVFSGSPDQYPRIDVIKLSHHEERVRGYEASIEFFKVEVEKWKRRYASRHVYEQSQETYDNWYMDAGRT